MDTGTEACVRDQSLPASVILFCGPFKSTRTYVNGTRSRTKSTLVIVEKGAAMMDGLFYVSSRTDAWDVLRGIVITGHWTVHSSHLITEAQRLP